MMLDRYYLEVRSPAIAGTVLMTGGHVSGFSKTEAMKHAIAQAMVGRATDVVLIHMEYGMRQE